MTNTITGKFLGEGVGVPGEKANELYGNGNMVINIYADVVQGYSHQITASDAEKVNTCEGATFEVLKAEMGVIPKDMAILTNVYIRLTTPF